MRRLLTWSTFLHDLLILPKLYSSIYCRIFFKYGKNNMVEQWNFTKFVVIWTIFQLKSRKLHKYCKRLFQISFYLTLPVLCISESCIEIKINLSFYFHTSLWCLKRFYEGLKGLHKTFWGATKKCENKNLS